MKSNFPKNANQTLTSKFKIGDIVCYSPYYDGDGGWFMSGDMGSVLQVRQTRDYQVVCVQWINPDLGCSDMSSEVLIKIVSLLILAISFLVIKFLVFSVMGR